MRWRPGHLALIVFQALWLNVIVPGHTRGIVTLPGTECGSAHEGQESCCAEQPRPACHADGGRQDSEHPYRRPDASHCAICSFSARLSTPPVIDLRLTDFKRLQIVVPCVVAEVTEIDLFATYFGRAPPVCI
jgi:hypothetical protein